MTVKLTNCQLQGVYYIHTNDLYWGLRGGRGGGAQYEGNPIKNETFSIAQ